MTSVKQYEKPEQTPKTKAHDQSTSNSNICSKLRSQQCYSPWNLPTGNKNNHLNSSSISVKWAFGWRCYCKAWVTSPPEDRIWLPISCSTTGSTLFNWIPPHVLLQTSAVKPYYKCNIWNWKTWNLLLFFVSSLIFTPITCWVLPVAPYLHMTLDSVSTHTHSLLILCNTGAASLKSQRWLWLLVSVSSCFMFEYFLDRTQKDNRDWKQHEHATAKTRLHSSALADDDMGI